MWFQRCGTDGHALESFQNATIPFAPNGELGNELRSLLVNRRLIEVSEQSNLESFEIENDMITGYYPTRVKWNLLCGNPIELIQDIEVCAYNDAWPDAWRTEVFDLCWKLALAECLEFYEYSVNQRGLFVSGKQGTKVMLENLLAYFSVAKCYHIIYSGAKAAPDFMVRSKASKPHASNYMIGACQRWADHVRVNNWDVAGYRRNYDLPRSMISYVLHDVFTKLGEEGITSKVWRIKS